MERDPIHVENTPTEAPVSPETNTEVILAAETQGKLHFMQTMRALWGSVRNRFQKREDDNAKEQFIAEMRSPTEIQDTKTSSTGIDSFIQKMKAKRAKRRSEPYINPPKLLRIPERSVDRILGFMKLRLTEQSRQNLVDINRELAERSLMVISNHQDDRDIASIITVLNPVRNLRQMTGGAGKKHYDFRRDPAVALLYRILPVANIRTLGVVQDDDKEHYSEEVINRCNDAFVSLAIKTMRETKSQVVGLTPEGTRVKDGSMILFKSGIGLLLRRMKDIEGQTPKIVPVSLTYKRITGEKIGSLHMGKPFAFEELFTSSQSTETNQKALLEQQYKAFQKIPNKEKSDAYAYLLQLVVARPLPPHMKKNVLPAIYGFFERHGINPDLLNYEVTGMPAYEDLYTE